MLGRSEAIATIAVKDVDAARKFYSETLGLSLTEDQEEGTLAYQTGGAKLFVYPSQYAGTNEATALTWIVEDVEAMAAGLRSKGVTFEHYPDLPETKIVGDVHVSGDRKLAWFKDPDGNIHALAEE